ncbi:putative porin [Paucibacter sp. AS339]|uniref:putative porin n=1 Tax=Paucibacter hankyongi TaxID=3133434 RepID=UPI0030B7F015
MNTQHKSPRSLAQTLTLSTVALAAAMGCSLPARAQQGQASADEKQELATLRATTQALIEALVSQGLITRERAEAIVKQARQSAAAPSSTEPQWGTPLAAGAAGAAAGAAASKVVRVPYVPESARQQMREEIKADVLAQARSERWGEPGAMPEWLSRVKIGGDLRVRAQSDKFDQGNLHASYYNNQTGTPAWAPDLKNTTQDRERMTLRARLDIDAKLSDQVQAGLRLSSGGLTGPASTSQTLGSSNGSGNNAGGFNRYNLTLDRAWLHWQPPAGWQGLSADFGRMPNPFYSSDLTWSDDLAFDGVAAKMQHYFAARKGVYATAGAFLVQELELNTRDKWLLGAQVGAEFEVAKGTQLKLGLAYYQFKNIEGQRESVPPPSGASSSSVDYFGSQYPSSWRSKGNTLININDPSSAAAPTWGLASKFKPVNFTAGLSVDALAPVMLNFSFDWVKNTGFDLADIRSRSGASLNDPTAPLLNKTTALQGRVQAGAAKLAKRGDWQGFLAYRYMERDAWVDAFTDTTWHLGGTNYKGWSLGGNYAFDRNFWLGARWTSTRNLDDGVHFLSNKLDPNSPLIGYFGSAPLRIDVIQLDLNARF